MKPTGKFMLDNNLNINSGQKSTFKNSCIFSMVKKYNYQLLIFLLNNLEFIELYSITFMPLVCLLLLFLTINALIQLSYEMNVSQGQYFKGKIVTYQKTSNIFLRPLSVYKTVHS